MLGGGEGIVQEDRRSLCDDRGPSVDMLCCYLNQVTLFLRTKVSELSCTAMGAFIESTGLSLFMDSLTGVKNNLESVGFTEVEVINRNTWFQNEARAEADRLEGELAAEVMDLRGQEATDSSNECQSMMIAVLDSGEFCPAHFFAKKPG